MADLLLFILDFTCGPMKMEEVGHGAGLGESCSAQSYMLDWSSLSDLALTLWSTHPNLTQLSGKGETSQSI